MATTLVASSPDSGGPPPHLWTRAAYHQIAELGLLGEEAKTELLGGQIYQKMPQGKAHVLAVKLMYRALLAAFGADFDLSMQTPLPLGDDGEPEPDVLVLRGAPRDYESQDPDPTKDVALVVEVSDSTLPFDQKVKARLYATHGVPEYWIVNLRERTLEIRRLPDVQYGAYAETRVLREGESAAIGGGTVAVSGVLPKA